MRRFGTALCVVALLCQCLLVAPVSAEKAAADTNAVDKEPTTTTVTAADNDYNAYIETMPNDLATQAIVLNAADATVNAGVTMKDDAALMSDDGIVTWKADIPASGWYTVAYTYSGVEGTSGADIELGLKVDGKYPYLEAERFVLPRIWVNDGEFRQDSNGNQFAPEQKEHYESQKQPMRDVNGFISEDLRVYLTEGTHKLAVETFGEDVLLYAMHLDVPTVLPTLEEKMAEWEAQGLYYTGTEQIVLETEGTHDKEQNPNDIVSKSDRSIIGLSDNSTPGVQPANAFIQQVNYIGGANWSMPDETITWKVYAPAAGVYKVGMHFRQNYLINATSYRSIKINGEHQYAEQMSLAFDYKNSWQFDDKLVNGEELLVYLNEGENTVTLAVTLGEMNQFSAKMESLILRLGQMYREIIAITGENPDAGRDYDLFARIPDLEERMLAFQDEIDLMIAERTDENGDIDDIAALLKKMNVVLEKMVVKGYEAQNYKGNYYDNYSGLSAQLQEMKNMALDIDCMVFAAPEAAEYVRSGGNFWEKTWFGVERFIASFLLDYNTAAGVTGEGMTNLTLWVNWSRDQTLVLNSLINGHFSVENPDISVTVRMTNASLLQGIMSGNGPDCSLSDARVTPVNMAMRGALVDLSQFEDYEEVSKWFVEGADVPYRYNGGVYGLPSTQQFYMLFYRTDIFEQYDLTVPNTWEEFLEVASILMLNNMQVGLPYTELKDIGLTNGGVASLNIFPTLLLQRDLSLYNKDMTGTSFTEVEVMQTFEDWTDYYSKYNLPKEYNFFNRFRIGLVPMAIQSYGQYSALSAAAPEIKGKWDMAEIPGTLREDGTIDRTQAGFGNACMILELSEHKDEAWRLLKWWMREDTQYRYALDIESILGVAGRYTSANMAATLSLDWGKEANRTLERQWNNVEEVAEIPGGYYVARAVDQAFWNVLSMNANPKDMMKKWGEVADVEITTKINQYKDDVKEGADE